MTCAHQMMCSTTHVKQSAWSITKRRYCDTVTLQHIENRAAEARHHLRYISHYSYSRSTSQITQGTTMIHYQLQSCNLAECAFTSFCSSVIRWGGDTPRMPRKCKATSQCMKLLTASALKIQITVWKVVHMCNWRKTVSLQLLYLQVFTGLLDPKYNSHSWTSLSLCMYHYKGDT